MSDRKKTALVTGAGSGIGRAIALRLARHQFEVILVGRDQQNLLRTSQLIEEGQGKSHLIIADLRITEQIEHFIEEVSNRWGELDVLVNNAGLAQFSPIGEMSWTEINDQILVNLLAPIQLIRGFIPLLQKSADASILNISSEQSMHPGINNSVYGCTKAALNFLTESLAAELMSSSIRVNSILPGAVDTPLLQRLGVTSPGTISDYFITADEIGRWGYEIITSKVMTGSLILVDGGASLKAKGR